MATVLVCICRTFQGCSRKVTYQICEWMAIIDFLLSPINYYLPCTPAEMTHCQYSCFQKSVLDLDGDLMIYCFFFLSLALLFSLPVFPAFPKCCCLGSLDHFSSKETIHLTKREAGCVLRKHSEHRQVWRLPSLC